VEDRERENTMTRELIILKIFWGNKCVDDDMEDDGFQQKFTIWDCLFVCLFLARQPPIVPRPPHSRGF